MRLILYMKKLLKKWDTKDKIVGFVLVVMILYLFHSSIELAIIKSVDSKCTPAKVYAINKKKQYRREYVIRYKYFFLYNNKKYEGFTPNEYAVGDTLMVVFWPKFPQINFSQKQIKYKCK